MNKIKKIGSLIVLTALVLVSTNVVEASTFTIGTRGQAVADLQIKLIEAGFDIPAITKGGASTGYYGVQTQAAENAYDNQGGGKVGAVSGPDTYFPYTANNNVKLIEERKIMTVATSTPCAYYITATSSLAFFDLNVASSTSVTSTSFTLATSTTAYATTSPITFFSATTTPGTTNEKVVVASGAYATLTWYPANGQNALIYPNTYLVLGVQGGLGNFGTQAQIGGTCQMRALVI